MDKEEFENSIKEIGTCEDEVKRRELLTSLNDKIGNVFDDNETLRADNDKYKEENDRLLESNRKYFMRLETQKTEREKQKEVTGDEGEKEREPKKFEDLFNEKGELKL